VALQYGVADACSLIPGKNNLMASKDGEARGSRKVLRGDPRLQLNILRELASAASDNTDVNTILQVVLEGMNRGIGLERVAIAFIKHHYAKAKYVMGEGTESWRGMFNFDVGPYTDNIFTHALDEQGGTWVNEDFLNKHPELMTPDISKILADCHCFVFVLRVGERVPALFYADRADYGGKLSSDQFDSFCHFATQAQLSLNALAQMEEKKRASRYY